jgi:hypothetical protein
VSQVIEIPRVNAWYCYSRGFVSFIKQQEDSEVVFAEGPFNELRERNISKEQFRKQEYVRGQFDCRLYATTELGSEGKCLATLHKDDGFLDVTGGSCSPEIQHRLKEIAALPINAQFEARRAVDQHLDAMPVRYLPSLTGSAIDLPIKAGEVGRTIGDIVRFAEWSQEYVLPAFAPLTHHRTNNWPKGVPHPIYFVTRGGYVRTVEVPYEKLIEGEFVAAVPTRIGTLVVSHRVSRDNVAAAGIYKIKDNKLERVLRGYVPAIAESPDGCRLAVVLSDIRRNPFPYELAAIDLCTRIQ